MAKKKVTGEEVAATPNGVVEGAVADAPVAEKKKDDVRDTIIKVLSKVKRDGIEDLIAYMDEGGFFTAPASGGFHSHQEGGLAQHSLNVLNTIERMGVSLLGGDGYNAIQDSTIIIGLLHDLGKMGDYGKQMYVPNVLKSGKRSESKPWERNKDLTKVPHAVRSIKLATLFIDLTEDEEWAILCHDGLYDFMKYEIKGQETPLYMLLHWADMWASKVLEGEEKEGEE